MDKDPGTPYEMDGQGSFPPWLIPLSREGEAKLKTSSFPNPHPLRPSRDWFSTRADCPGYRWSWLRWLNGFWRWLSHHLVRSWWLNWNCRWDKLDRWRQWLSCRKSPRDESPREKRLGQHPRHTGRTLVWQARKELS